MVASANVAGTSIENVVRTFALAAVSSMHPSRDFCPKCTMAPHKRLEEQRPRIYAPTEGGCKLGPENSVNATQTPAAKKHAKPERGSEKKLPACVDKLRGGSL